MGVGVVVVIVLWLLFMDALTVTAHYEMEPATVRKVVKNPSWRYIACDEMTLIRFDDGFDTDIGGNKGEAGDRILAPRQRGTDSMFGILGHREGTK